MYNYFVFFQVSLSQILTPGSKKKQKFKETVYEYPRFANRAGGFRTIEERS
jgi:hypothetical protein